MKRIRSLESPIESSRRSRKHSYGICTSDADMTRMALVKLSGSLGWASSNAHSPELLTRKELAKRLSLSLRSIDNLQREKDQLHPPESALHSLSAARSTPRSGCLHCKGGSPVNAPTKKGPERPGETITAEHASFCASFNVHFSRLDG